MIHDFLTSEEASTHASVQDEDVNEMRGLVETAHKKLLLRKMDSALIATQRYDKTKVST